VLPTFAQKIAIPGVHNAGKISEHLYRGAQPDLYYLSELKKLGITTIVDLRSESPHTAQEELMRAEALGMRFVRIPIGRFSTPTDADLIQFFRLAQNSSAQTIFLHCQFGEDRTGTMIAAYRIAYGHWTADQAISEMLAFGFNRTLHRSMAAFIRSLPDRLQNDPDLQKVVAPPQSSNSELPDCAARTTSFLVPPYHF
jgi:protein tyrosine/serine phosphatase